MPHPSGIDLDKVTRIALEGFPPHKGEVTEPCEQYAHRLLTDEIRSARKAGTHDEAWTQILRTDLDDALVKAAKTVKRLPAMRPNAGPQVRRKQLPLPPPPADELKRLAEREIAGAFEAPFDGSEARADVLAQRAQSNIKNWMTAMNISPTQRWIIKRFADKKIRQYRAALLKA